MWVDTNWVVITGAPSSGKTSVIDALANLGHAVQGEVARAVIERHLKTGKPLAEVRRDAAGLQREMLGEKVALEASMDPAAPVFMDRGMPDSITYYREAGIDTEPAVEASRIFRYRAVFVFDRLPLVQDDVRSEDDATASRLDLELEEDYRALGYDPVRVPVMPVAERVDFILKVLAGA